MGEPKAQKLPFILVQEGLQRIFFYQGLVLSEDDIKRVVNLARERNAYVQCKKRYGSGVRISSEMVLTSWHIIRKEENAVLVDGLPAELVYYRKYLDIALLRAK